MSVERDKANLRLAAVVGTVAIVMFCLIFAFKMMAA